jgi:hypothetical protein
MNMKYINMKKISGLTLALMLVLVSSCNQEFLNPSAASQTQVVSDVSGLMSLANGLTYKYSVLRSSPNYTVPTASGLLTRELTVLNAGNTDEELLRQGGNAVVGSNSVVTQLWNQSHLLKSNAEIIIANLGIVADQGTKGGLMAHASIFRALGLGNLATFWENAPIKTGTSAAFVPRAAVLAEAISTLEAGAAELAKAPLSSYFTTNIAPGIDYANTINALLARYNMMAGNFDKALTAANAVTISVSTKSVMNHDDASQNSLYFISFSNRNVTEPVDDKFSLPPALQTPASDKRIPFFINPTAGKNKGNASFFIANNSAVPIYRPGEVILLKAEANVRKPVQDLTAALTELNKVLQKLPASDALGIGADQPAYSGPVTAAAILDEIYKQRCIELYLSGLRLEDSRRFGRPATERGRSFLPYPFSERDNNSNTPADPAF